MSDRAEKLSMNVIVDKIMEQIDHIQEDSCLEELKEKKNIVLIRSAKEGVLNMFLGYLDNAEYPGNIYIIGRKNDKKCVSCFKNIHVIVYEIDDKEKYTLENCGQLIDKLEKDAICFLYQKVISIDHDNLFEILNSVNCKRYAISNQLEVKRFSDINKYLDGRRIYSELCSWFYEVGDRES